MTTTNKNAADETTKILRQLLNERRAQPAPRPVATAIWAGLSLVSFLFLLGVATLFVVRPAVLFGPAAAQPTPVTVIAPQAVVPQPVVPVVPVVAIPIPSPVIVAQPVIVPQIEQSAPIAQPVPPVVAPITQAQVILAQGRGPLAATPVPAASGAYALAPDFASGVLGPQQAPAPTFGISPAFK